MAVDWDNRKLTWRYDWAWLISFAVIMVGFLVWTIAWRQRLVFEEVAFLILAIAALNLVRGVLIVRSERNNPRSNAND
jgi:hypothetical protein